MHHWEHFDPRLLVCEAYLLPNATLDAKKKEQKTKAADKAFPMSTKANFSFANQFTVSKHEPPKAQKNEENSNETQECLVVSMFFNSDSGLLVYDSYARGEIYSKLISVRIPYHFFVTKVKFRLKVEKNKR